MQNESERVSAVVCDQVYGWVGGGASDRTNAAAGFDESLRGPMLHLHNDARNAEWSPRMGVDTFKINSPIKLVFFKYPECFIPRRDCKSRTEGSPIVFTYVLSPEGTLQRR